MAKVPRSVPHKWMPYEQMCEVVISLGEKNADLRRRLGQALWAIRRSINSESNGYILNVSCEEIARNRHIHSQRKRARRKRSADGK